MKGFTDMSIRFFVYSFDEANTDTQDSDEGFCECDEAKFLEAEGAIEYERHTVFANGVKQICLTKNPFGKG